MKRLQILQKLVYEEFFVNAVDLSKIYFLKNAKKTCKHRARSLAVSDLRSETKDLRFESGCELCAEVSSLQQSLYYCLSAREVCRSGSEELMKCPPPPLVVL